MHFQCRPEDYLTHGSSGALYFLFKAVSLLDLEPFQVYWDY